jgi:hypothetical protein
MFNKPKAHCFLKRMLQDYQEPLEDLDKANVRELNNASTLKSCANVKCMSDDYQRALNDLNKVDGLEPNNVFTWGVMQMSKRC